MILGNIEFFVCPDQAPVGANGAVHECMHKCIHLCAELCAFLPAPRQGSGTGSTVGLRKPRNRQQGWT